MLKLHVSDISVIIMCFSIRTVCPLVGSFNKEGIMEKGIAMRYALQKKKGSQKDEDGEGEGNKKVSVSMWNFIIANYFLSELFERAIGGLLKDSQLLFFAYADFEEERMKYDNVRKIYDKLLAIEQADPTLVCFYLFRCNCFSNYSMKLLRNVSFCLQNTASHFIHFPLHF